MFCLLAEQKETAEMSTQKKKIFLKYTEQLLKIQTSAHFAIRILPKLLHCRSTKIDVQATNI